MKGKYDDIINLEYQKSNKRPHMKIRDRAAQFASFSVLKGYEEALKKIEEERKQINHK